MLQFALNRRPRISVLLVFFIALANPLAGLAEVPHYVGSKTCTGCHPALAAKWQDSHHDRAMQPANEESIVGNFADVSVSKGGVTSRFFRSSEKFMVHTEGQGGVMGDFEVAYAFGVYPLQQYLIGFPDGRYQVLGLSWDARPANEGGQRWFSIYPDDAIPHDDVLHWTQPSQNWNHMCAECHSTNLRKGFDADTNRFNTKWSEIDVACEACHGPGSVHNARMATQSSAIGGAEASTLGSGLTVEFLPVASAQWAIDPKTQAPFRNPPRTEHNEVELCARCHASRMTIEEGVHPGQSIHQSHRVSTLDDPQYYADGQIRGEVYVYGSFVQSKMYKAGVTCSDCHDPHEATLRASGNALCTRCHTPERYDTKEHHHHKAASKGAQCVECHMPSTVYMGVDPRRDHSLRIPRPDLTETLGTPNACNGCHGSMTSTWATNKIDQWFGASRTKQAHWASTIHAAQTGAPDAEARLVALATNRALPAVARATAIILLRPYANPRLVEPLTQTVEDADAQVRTATLETLYNFPPEVRASLAVPALDDPVRSVRYEAARILAVIPGQQMSPKLRDKRDRVLDDFRAAQHRDADNHESHMRLGLLAQDQRQLGESEREYRRALERNPSFVPAYVNLANLFRLQEQDNKGEEVLRAGLLRLPQQPDLHHALGLALVRMKRLDEALPALETAATMAPEHPRYAYVFAVALHTTGKTAHAIRVLRGALKHHPNDPQIRAFIETLTKSP
jgi:predicted CXXCH cytochrome family protein